MRVLVIQLETCVKRPTEPSLYRIPAVTGAHSSCCTIGLASGFRKRGFHSSVPVS